MGAREKYDVIRFVKGSIYGPVKDDESWRMRMNNERKTCSNTDRSRYKNKETEMAAARD